MIYHKEIKVGNLIKHNKYGNCIIVNIDISRDFKILAQLDVLDLNGNIHLVNNTDCYYYWSKIES